MIDGTFCDKFYIYRRTCHSPFTYTFLEENPVRAVQMKHPEFLIIQPLESVAHVVVDMAAAYHLLLHKSEAFLYSGSECHGG